MKIFLTFLISVLIAFGTVADEKENKSEINAKNATELYITGTVTDKATGEALAGVQVQLKGTDKKAYTDFDGCFIFEEIEPGIYDISAHHISYEKHEVNQNIDVLSTSFKLELNPLN